MLHFNTGGLPVLRGPLAAPPPALLLEGILETKLCRGEDAHCGPFMTQSYPWPPSLWYPTNSSLAGKDVAAPTSPPQQFNELPEVT